MATATFTYMLVTDDQRPPKTYVGWAVDPEARLAAHNAGPVRGGAKTTAGRQWRLVYVERHKTRPEAMSREWHLKRDRRLRNEIMSVWRPSPLPSSA